MIFFLVPGVAQPAAVTAPSPRKRGEGAATSASDKNAAALHDTGAVT